MKNKTLTLIIFFISCINFNTLMGQENEPVYAFEIGIDMTGLVDRIFPKSGEFYTPPQYDYFLNIKYHFNKFSIRSRIGGYRGTRYSETNFPSSPRIDESLSGGFNFAIGLGKRYYFKERLSINVGSELMLHFFNSSQSRTPNTNGQGTRKTNGIIYGANLIGGLQFKLKPWLTIGSEASVRYFIEESKTYREFQVALDNFDSSLKEEKFEFLPTNGIFLIVHF